MQVFWPNIFWGQRRNPVSWFAKLWDGHYNYGFPQFLLKMSYQDVVSNVYIGFIIQRGCDIAPEDLNNRTFLCYYLPPLHSWRKCPMSFQIVDPQVALTIIFQHYFKKCASKIRYIWVFIFNLQIYSTERDKDGQGINKKVGRFSKFHSKLAE